MTALVFMGARLDCARCHGHPTENWTLDDNMGMAAFFAKVGFKATNEWKEEIVFFNPKGGLATRRRRRRQAEVPGRRGCGSAAAGRPAREVRRVAHGAAESLVRPEHRQPGLVLALGRGIVHEPDDLRPTNPRRIPSCWTSWRRSWSANKYDLKHIYRLILNSKTYQLSSKSNE